ncbi:hypothetical protein F393_gp52 [Bacillus phage phIS3501]|uniref:Uncharacterized protein n=1 Tax=Bacillus phage phIS3501 TaxID=1124578 RepID=H0UST4_9CAUD|nr:hypothetical protein F393_gp52 [Bacillus phage phIS3501]AEV89267.1 hypothetical protein phIS3501_003 [Bacillus phage phIS3501]
MSLVRLTYYALNNKRICFIEYIHVFYCTTFIMHMVYFLVIMQNCIIAVSIKQKKTSK